MLLPVGPEMLQDQWDANSQHWKNKELLVEHFLKVLAHRCEYLGLKEAFRTDNYQAPPMKIW